MSVNELTQGLNTLLVVKGGALLRTAVERGRLIGDDEVYRTASALGMRLLQAVRDRPVVE